MPTLFEALGNAIDLPASMARDALRLQNPLDQWLTPFSQDNRTTGQDLVHAVGIEGESPLLSFATELALDPTDLSGRLADQERCQGPGTGGQGGQGRQVHQGCLGYPEAASAAIRGIPKSVRGATRSAKKSLLEILNPAAAAEIEPTMLRSLGREEVDGILAERGDVEVRCEFCNRLYRFDPVDCAGIFAGLVSGGSGPH